MDWTRALTNETDSIFLNACLGSNQLSLFDDEDDKPITRRRTRSRIFDEFLSSPGKSPFRDCSRSFSSNGGRSSGYSDVFDDLIESANSIFNANELMAAIDQLPSEESDRPITPEQPFSMPKKEKFCQECNCECELIGLKWNKFCLKWNGACKLQQHDLKLTEDEKQKLNDTSTMKFSEQVEIQQAVDAIKREASCFEEEFNQKHLFHNQSNLDLIKQENLTNCDLSEIEPSIIDSDFQPIKLTQYETTQFDSISNFDYNLTQHQQPSVAQPTLASMSSLKTTKPNSEMLRRNDGEICGELTNNTKKRCGRPKSYKVEKTPPMGPNGVRLCVFCSGQVRPQMCGGNKHRWRCVDKKCRKWYGWVLSCDEIPNDLGKKGRWKDLVVKVSQANDFNSQTTVDTFINGSKTQPRRMGRPPKIYVNDDSNLDKIRTKFPSASGSDTRCTRKYTKKKKDEYEIKKSVSPLTLRQMSYDPSALERHSRWWLQPRRRIEFSPERDFSTSILNNAAFFRVIGNSMLTAAATKADEPGTINGAFDLLLDSLTSSMAPLLTLINKIPGVTNTTQNSEIVKKLWKASAIHTPLF